MLFICTHNSARSIMAEGLLNSLGGGSLQGLVGGQPAGGLGQPRRAEDAEEDARPDRRAIAARTGTSSPRPARPRLDFVFTVCDNAAGEVCPVWPGQPMTAHWGVPDPAAFEGSDEQKAKLPSGTRP